MGDASQKAGRAVNEAASATRSPAMRILARAGFVFVGLVHILIGFIALQIDRGQGGQADQSGAIGTLASKPGGPLLLWAGFAGCAALALWMLSEAVFEARSGTDSKKKVQEAGEPVLKAVLYGFLAYTFSVFASGGSQNSSQSASDFTARLMGSPAGILLLIAVGLAIIISGAIYVYRGVTRKFMKDLQDLGSAHPAVKWIGTIGYAAKGAVLGFLGILIIIAAATADPSKSSGLDGSLKTLGSQPYGVFMLAAAAAGLVCYGMYSMARARYGRF